MKGIQYNTIQACHETHADRELRDERKPDKRKSGRTHHAIHSKSSMKRRAQLYQALREGENVLNSLLRFCSSGPDILSGQFEHLLPSDRQVVQLSVQPWLFLKRSNFGSELLAHGTQAASPAAARAR